MARRRGRGSRRKDGRKNDEFKLVSFPSNGSQKLIENLGEKGERITGDIYRQLEDGGWSLEVGAWICLLLMGMPF